MELMVVVVIIGLLASVAIPMLNRYMKKSKTTEAVTNLRKIYDGEIGYYQEEHVDSDGLSLTAQFLQLIPEPPYPPTDQKRTGDFSAGNWPYVKFAADGPTFYSYMADAVNGTLTIPRPSGVPSLPSQQPDWVDAFVVRAIGDIDGDGVYSMFERIAIIHSGSGEPEGGAGIYQWDPLE